MSKYHLFVNKTTGERIITKDDCIWKRIENDSQKWNGIGYLDNSIIGTFMAGDIALDNGFDWVSKLTEVEVFAEML